MNIVKYSGEHLLGQSLGTIDVDACKHIAKQIQHAKSLGPIALSIGGGNIFRGIAAATKGMDRVQADYVGMLATIMNGMTLADIFKEYNIQAKVMSAIPVESMVETFSREKTLRYLEAGYLPLFVAGTGNPFFTADTGAVLRAAEFGIKKVYIASSHARPTAYSWEEAMTLDIVETSALAMAREQNITIVLFNPHEPYALKEAVQEARCTIAL